MNFCCARAPDWVSTRLSPFFRKANSARLRSEPRDLGHDMHSLKGLGGSDRILERKPECTNAITLQPRPQASHSRPPPARTNSTLDTENDCCGGYMPELSLCHSFVTSAWLIELNSRPCDARCSVRLAAHGFQAGAAITMPRLSDTGSHSLKVVWLAICLDRAA